MAAAGVGFFVEGEHPFTADEALEAVKLCLDAGGDPAGADLNGDTPLRGAAYRGVNTVVTLLVRQQRLLIDQAAADGGWTPWKIANAAGPPATRPVTSM